MDHLRELLIRCNVSQTELAKVLNRDKSAITHLLQGKRHLKAEEVVKIATFLNVSELEVLGIKKHEPIEYKTETSVPDEQQWIPFQTPPSLELQRSNYVIQQGEFFYFYDGSSATDKSYALEVNSNALVLSGFMIGDVIISELDKEIRPGDVVVVQHFNNNQSETLLRKYQPPYLVPHSSNPEFKRLHEERSNVRMISPVIKLVRILY